MAKNRRKHESRKPMLLCFLAGFIFFAFIFLMLTKTGLCAEVRFDSVLVSYPDAGYKIYIITHSPDSIDTNHMIGFGYQKGEHGWLVMSDTVSVVDSLGNVLILPPMFIYTETPNLRFDVNRDGQANVGDIVVLVKYVWGTGK